MNASWNRLCISPDRPLNSLTYAALERIDNLLRGANIPYMLIGATARDLLLFHVHGRPVRRATYDLDLAILVESWNQFASVKQMLIEAPGFHDKGRAAQRLHYTPVDMERETVIDIIPFGGVASADQKIAWPPHADVVMNVAAFADAFASRIDIEITPELVIPVVSLPSLVVLKLFAWLDRRNDKDVADIQMLLETYADAGNLDRLYDTHSDELERVEFHLSLAGANLLGQDVYQITDESTRTQLSTALTGGEIETLIHKMARSKSVFDDHTQYSAALFNGFLRGLRIVSQDKQAE